MARKRVRPIEKSDGSSTNNAPNVVVFDDDTANSGDNDARSDDTATEFPTVDPADIGTDTGGNADDGTAKRKRGRPPGGTRTSKAAKNDLSGLESLLYTLHVFAGAIFETPELVLKPDEAKLFAEATINVARHYNHVIDPKIMAWINLGAVGMGIYGTRLFAIRARLREERAAKPQAVHIDTRTPVETPVVPKSPSELFASMGGAFGGDMGQENA